MPSSYQLLEIGLLASARSDLKRLGELVAALDGYEFTTIPIAWVFERMAASFERGEPPNPVAMVAESLIEREDVAEMLQEAISTVWHASPTRSLQTDLAQLRKRHQGVKLTKGVNHAVRLMEKGDLDGAADLLIKASEAKPLSSEGPAKLVDLFGLWEGLGNSSRAIPTGFKKLDAEMIGIRPGEVGLIFGTTGMGKSILATNLGYNAMKLRRHTVVHIDTENGRELTQSRYLSRILGLPTLSILNQRLPPDVLERVKEWAIRRTDYETRFRIFPVGIDSMTLPEVRSMVRGLGWKPDLVIIDSPDHIRLRTNSDNAALDAQRLYKEVAAWAKADDIAIWAVTQADKSAEGKVSTTKSVAWGYDKCRLAHHVLTINVGADPVTGKPIPEDKLDGQRRLYVAKARVSKGRFFIPVKTDLAHAAIREDEGPIEIIEEE